MIRSKLTSAEATVVSMLRELEYLRVVFGVDYPETKAKQAELDAALDALPRKPAFVAPTVGDAPSTTWTKS